MTTAVRCSRCDAQRWVVLKIEAPYICARCRYEIAGQTKSPTR